MSQPDLDKAKQITIEHQEWLFDLMQWHKQCRDSLEKLFVVQQWLMDQSSMIGEHQSQLADHHAHSLAGRETPHDASAHEKVREAHQRLSSKLPEALAEFNAALDALDLERRT